MVSLEELKPRTGSFELISTGNKYTLRPFNIEDEVWLRQEFGDSLPKLFNENNIDGEALCRIAFNQLTDKTDFKIKEIVDIDEEGIEVKKFIGGYKLLLKLVQGMTEKVKMLLAINETLGVSRPLIEKMLDDDKKKELKEKPTGQ
jgi:hypothetical protein